MNIQQIYFKPERKWNHCKGYECKESFCGDTHGGATCGGAASEGGGFTRVLVFKGGRYEVLFRQDTGRRYK